MSTRALLVAALAGVVVLAANPARAADSELTIAVRGFGSWSAAVAAMQMDVSSERTVLHVGVANGDGARASCDRYRLTLDPAGEAAFTVGACDPATGDTDLTLTHRSALFAHDDAIPEPLHIGISALQVLTGDAAGGAQPAGGSSLTCSVAVQPYAMDLEHGTRVALTAPRYALEPIGTDLRIEAGNNGYTLFGAAAGSLSIEYRVIDTVRHREVTRNRATLVCANEPAGPPVPVSQSSVHPVVPAGADADPYAIQPTTLSVGFNMLGVGYVPLAPLTFHQDGISARGSQLQLDAAWTFTPSASVALDARWLHVALEFEPHIGEHFLGLQGRAVLAPAVRLGHVRLYAGASVTLSYWRLEVTPGNAWNTDAIASAGAIVGAGWVWRRASTAGLRVADVHIEAGMPIWGQGAFVLGFGTSWGGGL